MAWRAILGVGLTAAAVVVTGVAVTGGSAAPTSSVPVSSAASATPSAAPIAGVASKPLTSAPVALPVAVHIPKINVDSGPPLVPLYLNPDGSPQVPDVKTPKVVGYYALDALPGQQGAAVLLAHVDGGGVLGAFHDIGRLTIGDSITVDRADKTSVTFEVTRVETVKKAKFPFQLVFGPVPDAELRLVSCGGPFDAATGNYEDSVIVLAKMV